MTECLSDNELKEDYVLLPLEEKEMYEHMANANLIWSRFLHAEIYKLLKKINGVLSWQTMAAELGDIVNEGTIRKYVKS